MAINKSIEINDSGIFASYWAVVGYRLDQQSGAIDVQYGGFKDHDAFLKGKKPIVIQPFRYAKADSPVQSKSWDLVCADVEAQLLTLDKFKPE